MEQVKQSTVDNNDKTNSAGQLVILRQTPQSQEIEQCLAQAHFHEMNGFYFKENKKGSPVLDITPTVGLGQVSVSVSRWKLDMNVLPSSPASLSPPSSLSSGYTNDSKNGWDREMISLMQGNVAVLEISHRPNSQPLIVGGRESVKLGMQFQADIYIPHMSQPLGRMKYRSDSFENGTLITDCATKSVFITSSLTDLKKPVSYAGFKISDIDGLPVAIVQSRKGKKQYRTGRVHWTDWKIQYAPLFSANLMPSEKALLMVAALTWILTTKEKTYKLL